MAAFGNSGQTCSASLQPLAPKHRRQEIEARLKAAAETLAKASDSRDPATIIGSMVSQTQWERVQGCIRLGPAGYFVRPTVFTDVANDANDMRIAR